MTYDLVYAEAAADYRDELSALLADERPTPDEYAPGAHRPSRADALVKSGDFTPAASSCAADGDDLPF